MNVLGISAFFHDSACCLLQDGRLKAAAAEERFSRVKHDRRLPVEAFRYCLREGRIDRTDIDCIAYYERPVDKLSRQLWAGQVDALSPLDPRRARNTIVDGLGFEGPIHSFAHALSHAASAYCYSGFEDSALLTVDAVGEWTTIGYGSAEGDDLDLFASTDYPHSLGLLYSTITAYLGFRVNSGEYKVMGLAPYGEPRLRPLLERLVTHDVGPDLRLDPRYFDFGSGARMYSPALVDLLGVDPREPGQTPTGDHADLACSIQALLEDLLLTRVRWLQETTGGERLCYAGGMALNCVANGRIRREGPFREVFVPPAPGDDGAALGAAALAQMDLGMGRPGRMEHAFWGPQWTGADIRHHLDAAPVPYRTFDEEDELLEEVARRLAAGEVVGWFHGAMEWGPRALGSRSILADPRNPDVARRLNRQIKDREEFRPFAPSVGVDQAPGWFVLDTPSPFMLETCPVREPEALPAVAHVDGSARPQTVSAEWSPRFARLLEVFAGRTGCPVLLNTSFNTRGEPMVCSPSDALRRFVASGLDALVLEDCVLDGDDLPPSWPDLIGHVEIGAGRGDDRPGLSNLYAFV